MIRRRVRALRSMFNLSNYSWITSQVLFYCVDVSQIVVKDVGVSVVIIISMIATVAVKLQ